MDPQDAHEDTPLLIARHGTSQECQKPTTTPLPWRQLSILLLLHLAEAITSQVIAPFLPQLIRDIGVTHGDDSQVGYYVGLVHSLFYISQACTVFYWSRASDHIGRKPIVLIGVAGISMTMYGVGLSRTFWSLALSRCLCGALNGNIGVIKSMIPEITDSTNIARAFSFVPITWFIGGTIGPLIGGSLERPTEKFPVIFGNFPFFKEYPYLLPCFVSATYAAICWFIVALFLKETINAQISPAEYFLGRWRKSQASCEDSPAVAEDGAIIADREDPLSFRELLTTVPVLMATGSYASFAVLEISFRTMFPVYLATPLEMGGLGLDPPVMGIILAAVGISTTVFQLLLFSPLYNRLGGKNLFLMAVSSFFPIASLFPIASRVGQMHGLNNFVWLLLAFQILLFSFANFSLSVAFVYVNSAAPNRASIGATTGFAQMVVSVVRAIGPSTINSAFALGIQKHVMGGHFAYWMMAVMTAISLVIGAALPKRPSN